MRRLTAVLAGLVVACAVAADAQEIGFIEKFALADDRTEALKLLIPGSEEYYYFHCLHDLNTEQFDQVDELLKAWIKRYNYTPRVQQIQNRQALLTYEKDPAASLEFIRQRLGIQFHHQRETIGEKPNLPTELDQALLSHQRLTRIAQQRHKNLDGFENAALDWLAATELDPDRRRHLLERLQRPDHSNLAQLIVDDLNHRSSKPFGSMTIHQQLLQEQLDDCLRLKPDLLNQQNFINAYLAKLQPSDDVDWNYELAEYEAYLDRLWAFVSRLAPVHNSLKTHVLYHRLVHDRARGIYDKDRFMAYIRLPRNVPYIAPQLLQLEENRRFAADLNADFQGVTYMPPVRNDEPLVSNYLHHFFVDEANAKPYEPYISDVYLREHLAETKIVNGLGEPEQWYSLLPPDKYQALKDRIDLEFAHTNAKFIAADDPVSLDLHVKNVRSLIVRVFEVNTRNFYREQLREVNTSINLDGLVANDEQTFTYDEPPLRRVRRHFEFPALTKPGVYVIDFIGNGMNSRVVVRKGQLRHLVRTGPVGQVFTVLNEKNEKLNDATIWLAGHEYKADDQGRILVPFTTAPALQPIIIEHGGLSSLAHFEHQSENYQLNAGIYVDRESLLKRATSPVIVRAGLYVNGTPISLADLEDVRLTIASVDHEGVTSTKEVKDFKLFEDRESVYEFQTPARLSQLTFTLQARIQNRSQNQKIDLQSSETIALNQIDKTEKVEDLHFAKVNGEYVVDLRGKTGEAKPDRAVQLSIKHRDFTEAVTVSLQTDRGGRIRLGELADVASVTATSPEGTAHTWTLDHDRHSYYSTVHGVAGAPIELPYMGSSDEPTRGELSLLEVRGGTFLADRFKALSIRDGMLRVRGLPRGDYDLFFKQTGQRIRLRLAEGDEKERYVLGGSRQLEVRGTNPLQIAEVTTGDGQVRIQLTNSNKFSRVHLFATRQQPALSPFFKLSRVADAEPYQVAASKLTSLYVAGRSIGDEYQYIIDRRYARKFPGVMAERPSVLLNPWAVRSTEAGRQNAEAQTEFAPAEEAQDAAAKREAAGLGGQAQIAGFENLDFLGEASAVLVNLQPDDKGVITVPLDALGAHQHLHVVAVDPTQTAYRSISLPEKPMELVDLRLAAGLNPEEHFTQQKQITVVGKGEKFVLSDIATSRFETYDSLARVYALYVTLSGDAKLAEFNFILNWPNLPLEEKQTLYSKHACHELNFFLWKKDPKFFGDIVRSYLANKRDKTFLDHWLLDNEDLGAFQLPWDYARLNTVERILLSRRIVAERHYTIQDVRDRFALLPPDVDQQNFLFLTAIQGRALDADREVELFGMMAPGESVIGPGPSSLDRISGASRSSRGEGGMGDARSPGRLGELATPAFGGFAGKPTADYPMGDAWRPELPQSAERLRELSPRGRRSLLERKEGEKSQELMEERLEADFFDGAVEFEQARQLYQKLDKTQEWAENNYYKLPIEQQNADLVAVNAFWRDYVELNQVDPFQSRYFAEAAANFTEMMFALSVLDLPFEPAEHKSELADNTLTLTAGSPMIVFHEEIRPTGDIVEQTPILVSQNFFRHNDRYRQVDNERLDKFVTDEFLVHTVYGCQVVITNPTSSPQKLDVLLQIPLGALPVLNGQETRSVHLDLQPYNTQTVEYHFYFPAAGRYPHYPVHVAKNEKLLAHADAVTLTVVEQLSRIDRDSWPYISQNGSSEDVLNYLEDNNLHATDLDKIAFRMSDKPFFLKVVELLSQRHAYSHTLWSYGIKHNVVPPVRQYLQHSDGFVQQCGASIDSPLLKINPVARQTYQHLDFQPLVNARVHQLGRNRQIMNQSLHGQYHDLLTILGYRRALTDDDRMAITYYLLLQDRVEEAIAFFDQVNAADLETTLQHDYFAAYLSLYRADVDTARQIARRHVEHPVDRWRNAFVSLDRQIDEIDSGNSEIIDEENRNQRQAELAATEPSFELQVEAKKVRLEYQNLKRATVNYYLMDIELLFSRNPFVQQTSGQFSQILPNLTDVIDLPGEQRLLEFPLPDELQNRNVLVEVIGAGQTKSQAYYSNALSVQVVENYGHLRVTSEQADKPLAIVYVKAYARMKDGTVRFYKDGYTDLRGRFDYSSLNTNELDFVDKFALLVLSEEHGAVVREAVPPKR
ncbi:MAG: hypothetical protein O3C40_12445 [Planctomycetota bacterium]|nr:hypothetical protein [Planctomycetota bacterium]